MAEWWGEKIRLDTPAACRTELERCSTGMAYLDHLVTEAREQLDAAETAWESVEAEAHSHARRLDDPKGISAGELRGRVTQMIEENPDWLLVRDDLKRARRSLDLLERYYRTLEKRASSAQTAAKQHESERFIGAANL